MDVEDLGQDLFKVLGTKYSLKGNWETKLYVFTASSRLLTLNKFKSHLGPCNKTLEALFNAVKKHKEVLEEETNKFIEFKYQTKLLNFVIFFFYLEKCIVDVEEREMVESWFLRLRPIMILVCNKLKEYTGMHYHLDSCISVLMDKHSETSSPVVLHDIEKLLMLARDCESLDGYQSVFEKQERLSSLCKFGNLIVKKERPSEELIRQSRMSSEAQKFITNKINELSKLGEWNYEKSQNNSIENDIIELSIAEKPNLLIEAKQGVVFSIMDEDDRHYNIMKINKDVIKFPCEQKKSELSLRTMEREIKDTLFGKFRKCKSNDQNLMEIDCFKIIQDKPNANFSEWSLLSEFLEDNKGSQNSLIKAYSSMYERSENKNEKRKSLIGIIDNLENDKFELESVCDLEDMISLFLGIACQTKDEAKTIFCQRELLRMIELFPNQISFTVASNYQHLISVNPNCKILLDKLLGVLSSKVSFQDLKVFLQALSIIKTFPGEVWLKLLNECKDSINLLISKKKNEFIILVKAIIIKIESQLKVDSKLPFKSQIECGLSNLKRATSIDELNSCWNELEKFGKVNEMNIYQSCPFLDKLNFENLEFNGKKFIKFKETFHILPTKTKPKRITMIDEHGKETSFLLKNSDDLHQDLFIIHFFKTFNSFLYKFDVFPFGSDGGLIEWVEDATSLFSITRKSTIKFSDHYNSCFEKVLKSKRQSKDQWKRLDEKSKCEFLLQVYKLASKETRSDLIKNSIIAKSTNFNDLYSRLNEFTVSLADSSVFCYLLGIGDRHLDNILLNNKTSNIVHVDFNIAFDQGRTLKIPETVPFRLSKNLVKCLGVPSVYGKFKSRYMKTFKNTKEEHYFIQRFVSLYNDSVMWQMNRNQNVQVGIYQYVWAYCKFYNKENSNFQIFLKSPTVSNFSLLVENEKVEIENGLNEEMEQGVQTVGKENQKAKMLNTITRKLKETRDEFSLVGEAMNENLLSKMYHGWSAWV
ncbi:Phosphatidylinositol 3/4-kinase domain-containing protein [Rozella allomycis CSF55]|uniref:Phosphatidylinositol 3/4-kinase domain-containing protein n=1 Tax=Rozella allomycis (strain CSF55) TaxID=988480 RepID=A0A075ARH7_ROZAC|nr:Phosphatidylinositol 3/4-kinase domain-containing protein [Rozella allomycis CSF55]|eukprot:EPZ31331.1 Phosphatidylinositol 3/4-kinase domain-containing protein [Rozella allomycis CSF55]